MKPILVNQLTALVAVAEKASEDWDRQRESGYVMVSVEADIVMDMPDEVTEHASRFQSGPTSGARFMLPLGVLAKYALGLPIPAYDDGRDL